MLKRNIYGLECLVFRTLSIVLCRPVYKKTNLKKNSNFLTQIMDLFLIEISLVEIHISRLG